MNPGAIYIIGETVFDIIFEGLNPLAATPGGSMLNAAVTLGRVGLQPVLVTEMGQDETGKRILEFLVQQGVDTRNCIMHERCKTTLALAYLDAEKKAQYDFFHGDADRRPIEISNIEFRSSDILLLGSYYAVKQARRDFILDMLKRAKASGACIVYDPNMRKNHQPDAKAVLENMSMASIVKGSDEDFELLFGPMSPKAWYDLIRPYCPNLVLTRGHQATKLYTPDYCRQYEVTPLQPVSTVGAGDNFNAGLVYGLRKKSAHPTTGSLSPATWDYMIHCAIAAASEVCLTFHNFVPWGFRFPEP